MSETNVVAGPSRLERYEARTATTMTVLAVAFLIVYATPIVWTGAPDALTTALGVANAVLWVIFVGDLTLRAALSGRPIHYLIRHPIDILLVALPMLRPLRVLRVFTALQVLIRQGGRVSIGRTLAGAVAATVLLMFISAVAILDAERGAPGANIDNLGDALWWSGVTVTTVGYGDTFPVTGVGRMVAFSLMLVGISMIGVVTASIAAWFVGRVEESESELAAEVRALRVEIAALGGHPGLLDLGPDVADEDQPAGPGV